MTNRRKKTVAFLIFFIVLIFLIYIIGNNMNEVKVDFNSKSLFPCFNHPFGTDWLGRDMLKRTIKGLSVSIKIGVLSSILSSFISVIVGLIAGLMPKWIDEIVNWIIDLFMSIPHIVLLILISFAMGKGLNGVLIGIVFTHWTNLARLIRSEVLELKNKHYIKLSKKLGKSNLWIMKNHILPHIIPQYIVGLILLFPHAILHEASVTFLGFGLSPEQSAIGIILSESMKYLTSGIWWVAFFPGLALVGIVVLIDYIGENVKMLLNPYSFNQ